jgi:hypothetical protein
MTREAFIEILDRKGYPYEIEGDKIVVSYQWTVNLESLKKLPSGVEFNNGGDVWLHSLKTLHPGVEFKNKGDVWLDSLKTLPFGVEFNNGGDVWLHSLKTLHPGVEFKNNGWVSLEKLDTRNFTGIEGIDNRRLLNLMISKGVFER